MISEWWEADREERGNSDEFSEVGQLCSFVNDKLTLALHQKSNHLLELLNSDWRECIDNIERWTLTGGWQLFRFFGKCKQFFRTKFNICHTFNTATLETKKINREIWCENLARSKCWHTLKFYHEHTITYSTGSVFKSSSNDKCMRTNV